MIFADSDSTGRWHRPRAGGMVPPMKILVTGAAGFIGYHTCQVLLARGDTVVGLDNVNDYYDPTLKEARLAQLEALPGAAQRFRFYRLDLADTAGMQRLFASESVDRVIHLAAQAGVRYSLDNPQAYVDSNVTGFLNVLEGCRHQNVEHLTYASTSSVYGANTHMPFTEHEPADHPLAIYGATKRANELMAHSYAHLFGLPCTGLRFFTVYGPWGRPDLALYKFVDAILDDRPIDIYNHGDMYRDFTYVDDLVRGIRLLIDAVPAAPSSLHESIPHDSLSPVAPFRIVNIGNSEKIRLLDFIEAIEACLGLTAKRNYMPMQMGDVPATWADATLLQALTGYRPQTDYREGIARFVDWFRDYHGR